MSRGSPGAAETGDAKPTARLRTTIPRLIGHLRVQTSSQAQCHANRSRRMGDGPLTREENRLPFSAEFFPKLWRRFACGTLLDRAAVAPARDRTDRWRHQHGDRRGALARASGRDVATDPSLLRVGSADG